MSGYKRILFCLDNSDDADAGMEIGLEVAASMNAETAGCHVYAARLHDDRFRRMEDGLPEKYHKPGVIEHQREVHESLITKGLELISDSYTSVFLARASGAGVKAVGVSREGRNYSEIVKEVEENAWDLVVMGAHGLGRTEESRIGSVAERIVRRVGVDVLVARGADNPEGAILACIDGSPVSFGALEAAISMAGIFSRPIEAAAVFDPFFHRSAFRSLAGVLTDEAGRLFRFKEQEAIHDEVIDRGLAKIYRNHLEAGAAMAKAQGIAMPTRLLSGKAFPELIKDARATKPFMMVVGKTGGYATPEREALDIGSVAENCMREAPCSVLISTRIAAPPLPPKQNLAPGPTWTAKAEKVLDNVPPFARGIVRKMVDEDAARDNVEEITAEYMRKIKKRMEE